jgi:hypothetical protein
VYLLSIVLVKKLYLKVIRRWLENTQFNVYCVDSSNYTFPEIQNKRFHIYSFLYKNKDPRIGKSNGECKSIAYKYFQQDFQQYKFVIKITGRYFLQDLEKWTKKMKNRKMSKDLYTQRECMPLPHSLAYYFMSYVNSEIFICRSSKLYNMFRKKDKNTLMENHLFDLEEENIGKYSKLPHFKNTLKTKRGDNLILKYL